MKACQNCGAQMPDDLLFCTHCGSPLQEANYPGQQYQQQYPKPGGVFESNNLAVAAQLCENLAVMRGGQIVERGPTRQVLAAPQDEYTKMLTGAILPVPEREA